MEVLHPFSTFVKTVSFIPSLWTNSKAIYFLETGGPFTYSVVVC